MSEFVQFSSIFLLTSTYHVTMTMIDVIIINVNYPPNRSQNLESLKSTHLFLRYYFLPDLANYGY